MAEFFRKTDAGRRELRERRLGLPRVARNLLLIIDGTRSVRDWVGMIQGASLADAVALAELGLIEPGLGRAPGDSELAGLSVTTAPATLSGVPSALPAAWTRPGRLSELGDLPSPGAEPRHMASLGASLPTMLASLGGDSTWGDTSGAPLGRPGLRTTPTTTGAVPRRAAPAAVASPSSAVARAPAVAKAAASEAGVMSVPPSTWPGEDSAGFVPLDAGGRPVGRTGLDYSELYDSLNALVRETLGLLKGYRYTLRIERARNVIELEAVAGAFLIEVRRVRGDSTARMVERALRLGSG
ncbi:hypothetical protein [Sphaerotilus microaerophilus]|jgi:hypothetical protein|uniref:Uncharacterized protein n=1 Tax=Sphaerotilus microaerophilus TaxID=2914710 RepID=A0ABN6PJ61_9BURK|nr:hypothetical protein [Sphaerotilus sp. FB-5]BDI03746.1 hypothetical protein CATMQ487_07160 [Sphaerotilus sp. FB-5]